jgi:hypothetical protein
MLIPLGILASAGGVPPIVSDYDLLFTTTMPSDASSLTLSSLNTYASTYKHLQIRISAKTNRSAGADDLTIRFNGDSAANYSTHVLMGFGSMLSYGYGGGSMFIPAAAARSTSGWSTGAVMDVLDAYSTTKNKVFRALSGEGSGAVGLSSGSWYNTAALTSIQFLPVYASSIVAGSRFSVYGIKG